MDHIGPISGAGIGGGAQFAAEKGEVARGSLIRIEDKIRDWLAEQSLQRPPLHLVGKIEGEEVSRLSPVNERAILRTEFGSKHAVNLPNLQQIAHRISSIHLTAMGLF